ncbi:hypothetical protein CYMTET_47535 [Cymbomonas tetramitiformis]|uniref:Uncharacterized protein n=1 Tax=Cymbomonas tetramitiformis TaxID=36881 RepID=A0AAE0BVT7_9CHLO|nr:hypothetical protein CYMTET_47535 [Cymbomonas tetramitiformis]
MTGVNIFPYCSPVSLDSWWGRLWYTNVKPGLSVQAPCTVKLKDWRLACLKYVLQIFLFLFLVRTMFQDQTYLYNEVPLGLVSGCPDWRPLVPMAMAQTLSFAPVMGTRCFD